MNPTNDDVNQMRQIRKIMEAHLSEEQFGVAELAEALNTSRSNLLRKIRKSTKKSASQYMREYRLDRAMDILRNDPMSVSEVAFAVGFSSVSYFIKCFREHFGYPPGEVVRSQNVAVPKNLQNQSTRPHQLYAIMFTDIQGYTALMQRSEQQAIAYRNRHRDIFNTSTRKFGGRILQYYGDGTLSVFKSAIDAVQCAVLMQQAFTSEPAIPVRIGIHAGDIIITREDVIGDSVNIASRIESMAQSGGIYISAKVYDEIKNQKDIKADSIGLQKFKNVEKPLEIYAVHVPGEPHQHPHKLNLDRAG